MQSRHRPKDRRLRREGECLGRSVSPRHQHGAQPGGARGDAIDYRIPAIERITGSSAHAVQRHQRALRVGLSRPAGGAADNRGEMLREAEFGEDLFAQELRLVRADRHVDASGAQLTKRLTHAGEWQIGGHFDAPMDRAEFLDLASRVGRMRPEGCCDHRLAAHGVHSADQCAIGACSNPAFSKHLVNDRAGQSGTVDQRAV